MAGDHNILEVTKKLFDEVTKRLFVTGHKQSLCGFLMKRGICGDNDGFGYCDYDNRCDNIMTSSSSMTVELLLLMSHLGNRSLNTDVPNSW